MLTEVSDKKDSIDYFGQSVNYYHKNARIQREVAERLIASLQPWQEILPPGPILELGCGTGFVSQGLLQLFKRRKLILTDASSRMIEASRNNLQAQENVTFGIQKAEVIPVTEPTYAMTISNFAAQWFRDPPYTLAQWLKATKPGGLLLAAFPGNDSFPEWRNHAETLGLPFTGNELPDTEEMVIKLSSDITQVDYYEDTVIQTFGSAADFFRHIKKLGAGRQLSGRHLTPKEMKLLINHWDDSAGGEIRVSYHVVFIAVKRNS